MNDSNDYFIKKTLQKYLVPTILAILGTTAVQFINTLLAGRVLGKQALTAMNLLSSFTFLFAMFGCLINIGACARASVAMGRGDDGEVGEYETYSFVFSILMPAIISVLLLMFMHPLMSLLGCDDSLYEFMKSYARIMLIFGFLTTMMYFPFNFLRLDGRANISMVIFIFMGVLDVILLVVFLGAGFGLPGVAWATVISTGVADLVGVFILFFGKKRQIKPVFPGILRLLLLTIPVFVTGAAAGINNLCNMLRTLVLNALVLRNLGSDGASTFAVACSIISFASASVFGCGQTVSPLVGVFYGERDPVSIKLLMNRTCRYAFIIHGLEFIGVAIAAAPIAELFGIHDSVLVSEAAFGVRMAALSLIPAALLNVYIYYYTAVGRNRFAISLTVLRAFVLVVLFALAIFATGLGHWYMIAFPAAELAGIGIMFLMCRHQSKKNPRYKGLLLLDDSLKVDERLLSFSVPGDKDGAVSASRMMEQFCEENDMNPRYAMSIPLALEELLVVMGEHCLGDDKNRFADVRIMIDEDGIVLRIRCGGKLFDPLKWYEDRQKTMSAEELLADDTLGIKLISEKADVIYFKRTLGVNNLIAIFSS
ncbi:MAG: hypothetical protein J5819_03510 [Eubacterium sp.]|nr:hypothetical protein [Eubacterium sp.]